MPQVLLEPEQADLFEQLVEASRSRPRPEREEFAVLRSAGPDFVQGNGVEIEVLYEDIMTLVNSRLLEISNYHSTGTSFSFFIPPLGFQFYEELKKQTGGPAEQVQAATIRYLDSEEFRRAYPKPYGLWKEATDLLWGADSDRELSTIGHKCREAIQEYATALLEREQIDDVEPDVTKTRDRLSAVFKAKHGKIGEKHRAVLDALFSYWVAAGNLIQRQEHAGQREKEDLRWEDGRSVVFQTAVVMFEIDRALYL